MPRISAATVAEHRENQRRLLLDTAHDMLHEGGNAPSLSELAKRSGLARSSVYHYFSSREDLLNELVHDVFPKWTERITQAMAAEAQPQDRILAYAVANARLVDEGAHAVGSALAAITPGDKLDEQAAQMHRAVQEPLIATLRELNVQDPEGMCELINSVVHTATGFLDSGRSIADVETHLRTMLEPLARSLPTT